MIRALLLICLMAGPALAQEDPVVEVELDRTQIVPGQTATLRITILVPTWMPKPADFPSFETPNLRVRLPDRATTSISRQVDGDTWSGVTRRYLLSPMLPGTITLPAQTIGITYADDDGAPVETQVQTDPIALAGIVPPGAEGLDPFIAAQGLDLTQTLSGPTTGLEPGGSVIRTVTATITGASPIILPDLIAPAAIDGVRAYADAPAISEAADGDDLSGSRVEQVTLMAVGGGSGNVPGIRLDWFDLASGTVKTAEVEGFDISVSGPPLREDAPGASVDWRLMLALSVAALAVVALLWWGLPRLRARRQARHARYLDSETCARRLLLQAIARRDYGATVTALQVWRARSGVAMTGIDAIMLRLGATRYAARPRASDTADWIAMAAAVKAAHPRRQRAQVPSLPSLNPG